MVAARIERQIPCLNEMKSSVEFLQKLEYSLHSKSKVFQTRRDLLHERMGMTRRPGAGSCFHFSHIKVRGRTPLRIAIDVDDQQDFGGDTQ
jgi:hypothetical protein